jgi:uncharacterized protein YkwD
MADRSWLGNLLDNLFPNRKPTVPVVPAPNPTPNPVPDVSLRTLLLDAHNNQRKIQSSKDRLNRPTLKLDDKLNAAAQKHAEWMAANDNMSHTGANGSTPFERLKKEGYFFRLAGENIAAGYMTVNEVMNGWMSSPGHRDNILGLLYTVVGFGVYSSINRRYWCTVLASPTTSSLMFQVQSERSDQYLILDAEMLSELEELGYGKDRLYLVLPGGISNSGVD